MSLIKFSQHQPKDKSKLKKLNLLSDVNVLDLTQRLPGPLSTSIMFDLGANVTKVEPSGKEDAFVLFSKEDPLFGYWYKALNEKKNIIKTAHSYNELSHLIENSDIVVTSFNHPVNADILKNTQRSLAMIEVCGSSKNISMHDINALAMSASFELFTHNQENKRIDPPYLPIAGITFGQHLATTALAALHKAKKENSLVHEKVYIDDVAKQIYDHFWQNGLDKKIGSKFLHNGKYPCYNLYQTKDGHYLALAAVEEKFWLKFSEISELPLQIEDRFDTTDKVFNILGNYFNQLTLSEIKDKFGEEDICLTTIN